MQYASDINNYNYQYTGKDFAEVCTIFKETLVVFKVDGTEGYNLLVVDYFLWNEFLPLAEKKGSDSQTPLTFVPKTVSGSNSCAIRTRKNCLLSESFGLGETL